MADEFTPEDLELLDEISADLKAMIRRMKRMFARDDERAEEDEQLGNNVSSREKNSSVEAEHVVSSPSLAEVIPPTAEVVDHVDACLDLVKSLTMEIVETTESLYDHRFDVDIVPCPPIAIESQQILEMVKQIDDQLLKPLVAEIHPTTVLLDHSYGIMKEQITQKLVAVHKDPTPQGVSLILNQQLLELSPTFDPPPPKPPDFTYCAADTPPPPPEPPDLCCHTSGKNDPSAAAWHWDKWLPQGGCSAPKPYPRLLATECHSCKLLINLCIKKGMDFVGFCCISMTLLPIEIDIIGGGIRGTCQYALLSFMGITKAIKESPRLNSIYSNNIVAINVQSVVDDPNLRNSTFVDHIGTSGVSQCILRWIPTIPALRVIGWIYLLLGFLIKLVVSKCKRGGNIWRPILHIIK